MSKKREKNPYLIERYRIISEFTKSHMKRSLPDFILMSVWFFLAAAFAQMFFVTFLESLYSVEGWEIEGLPESVGPQIVCIALFGMVVMMLVPFYISLKRTIIKLYYKFRDEYRVLYISGLNDSGMMWEVANFPVFFIAIAGIIGCITPVILFDIEEMALSMLCLFFVLILVAVSYKIMEVQYNKNFSVITGLDKEVDISNVDGTYKLISWLSVEENVALPYRMYRGKDSVKANEEISYIARDLNIDGLLRVEASNLTMLHRVETMILRAYSVAGRSIKVDERLLGSLSESDRAVVDALVARIMNPLISEQYIPSNVLNNIEQKLL